MTKKELKEFLAGRICYLDGATGSNLMKAGMPSGVCTEQWILEHKEVCLQLQKDYVAAGSDILYCPTFTANRIKLTEYGLEKHMSQMIGELVEISREAAATTERKVLLAGDLTMTGRQLLPLGTMELETLIQVYKEQIQELENAGVDLLIVETMMSLQEARAALIAAKECSNLAVMVTLTFEPDGRTLFGTDAATAAIVLEHLGAAAIGANCSTGPAGMQDVIRSMSSVVTIPIIAKPNAGLPETDANGKLSYRMTPQQFAEEMKQLVACGASVLGGCCGTTPEHIFCLKEQTTDLIPVSHYIPGQRKLTSERQSICFDTSGKFIIVGERINPTGKKALQAELKSGSFELVKQYAEEQEANGAQILDVNMGMAGIDEKQAMLTAMREISTVSNLPLSLDSSHIEVLEEALRQYPGRALINSISMETEKLEKLIPLAAKYGAMFILLPLSDKGLPESLEEKKQIIQIILDRALEYGLTKEDIIVDGLVTTVGANPQSALETLETIRFCKELGLATICGLSNISFGLPARPFVNTAFLTLAIKEGLTMAIANPSQELLVCAAFATDMLLHKEGADLRYIEYASNLKDTDKVPAKPVKELPASASACENEHNKTQQITNCYRAVLKGNRTGIRKMVQEALDQGEIPSVILNRDLLPAINEVGTLFDKGKYFLPQLIASAEAMKNGIELLEPLLPQEQSGQKAAVIVLATVEGDIHDIGKNLVALMLKNHGFQVIDLGKDVSAEKIIETACEENAAVIGLSALMTTTMVRMQDVVRLRNQKCPQVKILIGGAVVTKEYARQIGADAYAADAAEAVRVTKELVN